MSFFSNLLASAKAAIAVAEPIIQSAEAMAPIIGIMVPGSGPAIAAAEGVINAIDNPEVRDNVANLITDAENIINAASPEVKALEDIFTTLFHQTAAPQALLVTPKTTVATVG